MTFIKEGVHCTSVGSYNGLSDYIHLCRANNKPISIQAVDSTAGVYDAMHSGEHAQDGLVFRRTKVGDVEVDRLPVDNDTGLYTGNPLDMAHYHFGLIYNALPMFDSEGNVELDFANRVYTASINEPSREFGDIQYLADYTLPIAQLFLNAGVKYLAYGWSTGTPDIAFWENETTLEFLRLCEANPTMLGISIHEYSLNPQYLQEGFPYLIGRISNLLSVCDKYGIAYPYIHIGEFGWGESSITVRGSNAVEQLQWADEMYKSLGINPNRCLWSLGQWHGSVVEDAEAILPLITERCVNAEEEPELPAIPKIVILKLPQEVGEDVWIRGSVYAFNNSKNTMTASSDDMLAMLSRGNAKSYAIVANPELPSQREAIDLLITNQYNFEVIEL